MHTVSLLARRVAPLVLMALMFATFAAPASAVEIVHRVKLPLLADKPSDPIAVAWDSEFTNYARFYPTFYQQAQAGCPTYYVDQINDDGTPAHVAPIYDGCATDRISMFQHDLSCKYSYAKYCLEQVVRGGYLPRKSQISLYGVLYTAGEPVLGRRFYLERQILGVEHQFFPFHDEETQTTGEIGSVRTPDVVASKTAYRWGVLNDAGQMVYGTMPLETKVLPTITYVSVDNRAVRRQQTFNTTIRTDVPIYGFVRLEYRYNNRWIQITRVHLTGQTTFVVPGRINRTSGVFPFRINLDGMSEDGRPWYDPLTKNSGRMTVKTNWVVTSTS